VQQATLAERSTKLEDGTGGWLYFKVGFTSSVHAALSQTNMQKHARVYVYLGARAEIRPVHPVTHDVACWIWI
jgi:hypothetical protein